MEKLTNEENIKNLLLRKRLRIITMMFGFLTIILAILDLYFRNWLLLTGAIISFIISTILTKKRDAILFNKSKKLQEIERTLEKHKVKK